MIAAVGKGHMYIALKAVAGEGVAMIAAAGKGPCKDESSGEG